MDGSSEGRQAFGILGRFLVKRPAEDREDEGAHKEDEGSAEHVGSQHHLRAESAA